MKIKIPDAYGNMPGYMDVEIPTADLIAELNKRRPECKLCENRGSFDRDLCINCIWYYQRKITDNFKPKEAK